MIRSRDKLTTSTVSVHLRGVWDKVGSRSENLADLLTGKHDVLLHMQTLLRSIDEIGSDVPPCDQAIAP